MKYLLCIVYLLFVIYNITQSECVQKVYMKANGSHNGVLKQIPTAPGQTACAGACMQTSGCQSFTYDESTSLCLLQKKGYGRWIEGKEKTASIVMNCETNWKKQNTF